MLLAAMQVNYVHSYQCIGAKLSQFFFPFSLFLCGLWGAQFGSTETYICNSSFKQAQLTDDRTYLHRYT